MGFHGLLDLETHPDGDAAHRLACARHIMAGRDFMKRDLTDLSVPDQNLPEPCNRHDEEEFLRTS